MLSFNSTTGLTYLFVALSYNKAERIVKRYEWELAEWKRQVEGKPAEEKKPPERESVLEKLHRIRDEAQKPPKRSYRARDER